MKTTNLMRCALCVAVLAMFCIVGCEKADFYSIDSPADLQSKIDSIAAAKASVDTGDTTYITIATALVGAEDFSNGWWTTFSDYFTISTNELLHLEFDNYNSGSENNWENWCLALVNVADRDAEDYAEYFVLRSDAYGWGNDDFDLGLIAFNYPDTDGDDDIWNDFRATMNGASVTLEIDHSATGNVYVTATAVGTDGTELVMTYQQPVSASADIVAFLVNEVSYLDMKKAYLIPSKVTVIEDVEPVSMAVEGAPAFVELGDEDFWGDAIATVTYADGSSAEVDTADVTFTVVPDMTTLGEKTVIVAYSKTKLGEYTKAITTYYNFEVTNSVVSMAVTTMPEITTYAFFETAPVFDTTGLVVTATYSDGTTGIMDNATLQFEIPTSAGMQNAVISYVGATGTVTTTCPLTLVQGASQVGAGDLSTGFWGALSADYTVTSNSSETVTFYTYSDEVENWHCPITVLRNADYTTEYAVTRWDNAGWGDYGFGSATLSSDWNWDIFLSNISGSKTVLTVTNNGDNTADVRYDVTYPSGETHFQLFEGITIDSADLTFAVTVENCYHVIVE
ncbi:hypothetical protein ACT3CD_11525 [Geofilum sp. OHC36d9]|uniref:hypothetical protein n=1 Tax=Geofilum sp. OHC36d9 TaxID=3458413 RepID=UPI004034745D